MTEYQIKGWWKMIEKAAKKAPTVVPAPRINFCWYCSSKLRNKAFAEIEVDGENRIVHKQCARFIIRGDWEQAEHPEKYIGE